MNSVPELENWCVTPIDSTSETAPGVDFVTLVALTANALYDASDPAGGRWNAVRGVDLVTSPEECVPEYLQRHEMRFRYFNSAWPICAGHPACADASFDKKLDPFAGHDEYVSFTIDISPAAVWAVNHEVGHVLGLCDGGLTFSGSTHTQCGEWAPLDTECLNSVMHPYGCNPPGWPWPTSQDIDSVENLIPVGGSGQGGSGGGGGKAFN
jgi:hypothetical protein